MRPELGLPPNGSKGATDRVRVRSRGKVAVAGNWSWEKGRLTVIAKAVAVPEKAIVPPTVIVPPKTLEPGALARVRACPAGMLTGAWISPLENVNPLVRVIALEPGDWMLPPPRESERRVTGVSRVGVPWLRTTS